MSSYLERYLWPNLLDEVRNEESSFDHAFSTLLMINEKAKQNVSVFSTLLDEEDGEEKFSVLFTTIVSWTLGPSAPQLDFEQRTAVALFLINVFKSLEVPFLRKLVLQFTSLPIWHNVSRARLDLELQEFPSLRPHWKSLPKKQTPESRWLPSLIDSFIETYASLSILSSPSPSSPPSSSPSSSSHLAAFHYCQRFLELLVDLLSQLPTRRFLRTYLSDINIVTRLRYSPVLESNESDCRLLFQLVKALDSSINFAVNDQTGEPLTKRDSQVAQTSRIHALQSALFIHPMKTGSSLRMKLQLSDLAFASCAALGGSSKRLGSCLEALSIEELESAAVSVGLNTHLSGPLIPESRKVYLLDILRDNLLYRPYALDVANELPLYPTEEVLWDTDAVPVEGDLVSRAFAIPKLNLQFLTFHDYLLRNYSLFRLESAYAIREDIMSSVRRMAPCFSPPSGESKKQSNFQGWSRMAVPLKDFRITQSTRPSLGQTVPQEVIASVEIDLNHLGNDVRAEWDALKPHDVIFLLSVKCDKASTKVSRKQPQEAGGDVTTFPTNKDPSAFADFYGVRVVRGAEVVKLNLDEDDPEASPDIDERNRRHKSHRSLRIRLDPVQYHRDVTNASDCYDGMNLLLRRDAKENNFKGVLEAVKDIMNTTADSGDTLVPSWLQDVFLGYGDPASAHHRYHHFLSVFFKSDEE
jgi:intron-binding protein aquarius